MLERLFMSSPWVAAALAVIAYALHYYLSIYETRLYLEGASRVVTYEGMYEPPPGYEAIVMRRRPISWRVIWVSLSLVVATAALWWAALRQLQRPEIVSVLMGGWVLMVGTFILRDLSRIALFRYLRSTGGAKGALNYSERLTYLTGAVDFQVYAAFYLFLFFVVGDLLFLGGAFMCFVTGRRRRDWGLILEEKYPR